MITQTTALHDFFVRHRERGDPLVLATIVETIGSTYRKAGAQMLIAHNGEAAGLLSGGCAESDLIERAQKVLDTGIAEIATYDTRGSEDAIWGLGLGCEGAMRILLTKIDAANAYQPFAFIDQQKRAHRSGAIALLMTSNHAQWPLGFCWRASSDTSLDGAPTEIDEHLKQVIENNSSQTIDYLDAKIFLAPIELPLRLLILGAGADAVPVAEIASLMGWQVTLQDHRPAYAIAERFTRAASVLLMPAEQFATESTLDNFDAAIVMSHHLTTDGIYLAALAKSNVAYVGLLGPANRRARLLAQLDQSTSLSTRLVDKLAGRLAGPVGLDIGAQTPEAIALAIVAEIHAHRERRSGGSFSGLLPQ